MPVKCTTCNNEFTKIAQVADHISRTNKVIQRQFSAKDSSSNSSSRSDFKDPQQMECFLEDGIADFSHRKYFDRNGKLIPLTDEFNLYTLVTTSTNLCLICRARFANNYRRCEHILETGHIKGAYDDVLWKRAIVDMKMFEELERKYF
jgi:hypothetical protein